MAPLRINKTFSPLGTPDHVQIYTEKLACHALSNWIAGEAVKKILAPSAAPSALIAEAPNSRPHGRAYSLAALRASAPIWETPGTASSGLCAHMGNSRYCLFGPLRPYGKLQVLPLRASWPVSGNSRYCLFGPPGPYRETPGTASSGLLAHMGNSRYCLFGPLRPYGKLQVLPLRASAPIWETPGTASSGLCAHMGNSRYCLFGPLRPYRETPDTASPNLQVNVGTPARVPNGTHL
jgi:hypothetical protein